MSSQLTEQDVLRQLDIPDFRHLTKDKVMSFATMLNNMDPEVAKKALEQFPDFAKMSLEVMADYKGVMEKAIAENTESSKQCFDLYNEVIAALKDCLKKDDLPFEEKKYYIDKMTEILKMAEVKESENKSFNWKVLGLGALTVISVIGVTAGALGGNFNIKLPKIES